jgi:hypothetical protein
VIGLRKGFGRRRRLRLNPCPGLLYGLEWGYASDAGGSHGKSKRAPEERHDENEVTTRKAAGAIYSQQRRRGRAYDQDEMVRNEQAFLPEKKMRKHRLLFGEDACAQPQWGGNRQTRTKSRLDEDGVQRCRSTTYARESVEVRS